MRSHTLRYEGIRIYNVHHTHTQTYTYTHERAVYSTHALTHTHTLKHTGLRIYKVSPTHRHTDIRTYTHERAVYSTIHRGAEAMVRYSKLYKAIAVK